MKFLQSFKHAGNGILLFFLHERNGQVQLVAALGAIGMGWFLKVSVTEWILITGCITAVLSLEMLNTAIEKLSDVVIPGFHDGIKTVKDIAAGSVLLSAAASLVTGILIFVPKILKLL
ncbi:MAG: diacylglycerol kinase family protein [Chitinophagaceae bacterium]|nr:diacylglycerol kinase family protein [Chitinophagaceae bacterium]